MKNNLFVVSISSAILIACATTNPVASPLIDEGIKFAKAKAECEASGKDFRCASPMADCGCVERPAPTPASAQPPASPAAEPVKPASEPAPATAPTPPAVAPETSFTYAANEWYEVAASGKAGWNKGKVTFSIRGLAFNELPRGKDGFLFMAKLKAPDGREGNFHYNIADLTPRLISQRFDGTCPRHCERQDIGDFHWRGDETYSFVFEWDESNVTCVVADSRGAKVFEGIAPTYGVYAGVDWIRIGNGVVPPYPGLGAAITVIDPKLE